MNRSVRSVKTIGAVLAAAVTLAVGCDANHILGTDGSPDAGGGAGGGGHAGTFDGAQAGSSAGSGGAVGGSTGAAGLKAGPLGPSQSWTGYIEQAMFPSGSDQVKLTFAQDANGVVAGTVVFGMGTPPPPATDPDVGYPVSSGNNGLGGAPGGDLTEGYTYAFDGGTLETHRLRFSVNMAQLWAGWCALQTQASDGSSGCVPNWSGQTDGHSCWLIDPKTNQRTMYDCGKVTLCSPVGVCACSAAGCTFNEMGPYSSSFDLFMSGDTLSGSAQGPAGGTFHFVRD
jgi:hypothetical protein